MEATYNDDYDAFAADYSVQMQSLATAPAQFNAPAPPTVQSLIGFLDSSLPFASHDEDLHRLTNGLIALNLFDSESEALIRDFKEYLAVTKDINEAEASLVQGLVKEVQDKYNEARTELLFCDTVVEKVAMASGLIAVETSVAPKPKVIAQPVAQERTGTKKKNGPPDKATKFGGKKANFSADVTEKLLRWLAANRNSPTMTDEILTQLSEETKLTKAQIRSWMTNAKRRRKGEIEMWAKIIEKEQRGEEIDENGGEGAEEEAFQFKIEAQKRGPKRGLKRKNSVSSAVSSSSKKKVVIKKERLSSEESSEDSSSVLSEEESSSLSGIQSSDSDEPPKKKRKSPIKY